MFSWLISAHTMFFINAWYFPQQIKKLSERFILMSRYEKTTTGSGKEVEIRQPTAVQVTIISKL